MKESVSNFKKTVIAYIVDKKITDEKEIDKVISAMAESPLFKDLTDADKLLIRNQIHSEYSITLDKGVAIVSEYKPWFMNRKKELSMKYWDRYKQYLLNDKGFTGPTVNTMDDVSDELTDLLGDPTVSNFQRRGLIIGDVQSGKTANYSGLICKAADAGYKVIVLLTGTIEKLRKQTQQRIDEAFTGMDSNAMIKQKVSVEVGVGKYDKSLKAVSFTSKTSDFNAKQASNLGLSLNSLNDPVIFVIKKNVNALSKLNDWFKTFNVNGNNKIDASLLMVDDESDNASINTNPEDKDPTRTNDLIVKMLSMFNKASYVGFTATPFANIFIDPDSDEDMKNENLFPKDYIYSLNAPSNYIGARNIFADNAKYQYMLKKIKDAEEFYPINHNKEYIISDLAPSLREAINVFLLANVVRDLRGDISTHRSMIVNISRFVNCQDQVYELINNYLKEIQNSVRLYCMLNERDAIQDSNILFLKKIYNSEYPNVEFDWNTIQNNLYNSIASIQVNIVNQKNYGTLNYEDNEENGLRTIAVGGLSLSRGLTLEGLIVSYFYRNSKMYDTLMQMGRWFGYRKNYEDLCRIYMSQENIDWYEYISEATDELRRDVKRMRDMNLTPEAFGFRVRNDVDTLLVTARNKMRTSKEIKMNVSLSSELVETPYIYDDNTKNQINIQSINSLISDLIEEGYLPDTSSKKFGFRNIDKKHIIKLLEQIDFPIANSHFDALSIAKFINNYEGNELNKWDILFASGSGNSYNVYKDININMVQRSFDIKNKLIRINKSKIRLGNPGDPKFGLTDQQINLVEEEFKKDHLNVKSISNKCYFSPSIIRNPLLIIYPVELKQNEEYKTDINKTLMGIAIGIPNLTDEKTKYAIYKVNKIFDTLGDIDYGDEE